MRINRLSASRMKCYKTCPFKDFMSYQIRIPQKPHFAAEVGSFLHVIYERYAQAFINGVDEEGKDAEWIRKNYKKMILEEFKRLKSWKYNTHVQKVIKDCDNCKAFDNGLCKLVNEDVEEFDGCAMNEYYEACNMIARVIDDTSKRGLFSDTNKIIGTEAQFKFDIERNGKTYTLNGIIDLVIQTNEDTIEILDYKTGRHQMSYPEAQKDLQLMLYYLAARKLYPNFKHHMVTIFYVQGGLKQITTGFDDDTEEEILERATEIWDSIESDVRPTRIADMNNGSVRPQFTCKYMCDWETCEKAYPALMDYLDEGGDIDNLYSLKDLGINIEEKDEND